MEVVVVATAVAVVAIVGAPDGAATWLLESPVFTDDGRDK